MTRKHKGLLRWLFKKNTILLAAAGFLFCAGFLFLWAATLKIPDLQTFDERKVEQSTKIYDRTGEILLFDIHENTQRTVVPLNDISRHIKNATVAIEDSEFYTHHGIKPTAILRAIFVNIGSFGYTQGGSTITQQVVKNSILTKEKTIARKLKEWVLSLKLETVASKERILELYLNEAPYGGNIYGIEEASRAFFAKNATDLSLVESAYLAALPQAPTYYSPYGNHQEELRGRKNTVLARMQELGFISEEEYKTALAEEVVWQPQETRGIKAPHFVFYIREQLEKKYGEDVVETGGLKVVTTLDYEIQKAAEETIARFAEDNEKNFNAKNAAMVAIDPKTGQMLAMVGSRDYFDAEHEGNFNVALAHRQPGSAFKPIVYATALMKGYLPETVVFDVETQFHTGCDASGKPLFPDVTKEDCYMPQNYDTVFRGPVSFRNALAQSINIPALKVLYLAGLKDSLKIAREMGIRGLNDPARYGLTLVLGGGEVSLLELTSAYSVFANEGIRNPEVGILQIKDASGTTLEEFRPKPIQVLPQNVALQISDILSDNDARSPAFGERSSLYFPERDVAVKTGTTNDYRDAWLVGYPPNIAVGMWAGNNDNTPMEKKVAGFIVAPVWNAFLQEVFKKLPEEYFKKPEEVTNLGDIKPIIRGKWVGGESYFVDTITQKLATAYTPAETKEERFVPNVHSILYWVNKEDPLGPPPEKPAEDPQFLLWEAGVQKWIRLNGIPFGTSTKVPLEYDTVHKPEFAPRLSLPGFDGTKSYSSREPITIRVSNTGRFGLSRADFFINNVYVGKASAPFVFSFVPENIGAIQKENTLRVVGFDVVMNKGSIEVPLLVSF